MSVRWRKRVRTRRSSSPGSACPRTTCRKASALSRTRTLRRNTSAPCRTFARMCRSSSRRSVCPRTRYRRRLAHWNTRTRPRSMQIRPRICAHTFHSGCCSRACPRNFHHTSSVRPRSPPHQTRRCLSRHRIRLRPSRHPSPRPLRRRLQSGASRSSRGCSQCRSGSAVAVPPASAARTAAIGR